MPGLRVETVCYRPGLLVVRRAGRVTDSVKAIDAGPRDTAVGEPRADLLLQSYTVRLVRQRLCRKPVAERGRGASSNGPTARSRG